MRTIAGVGIAGAVGALARYGLEGLVARRIASAFPWGTLVVNLTGAFLLGLVFAVLTERATSAPWLRSAITMGFLGAYTTFSTLSLETLRLVEDRAYLLAGLNGVGSLVLGLLAVWAGAALGRGL